ncbi:coiled-coil domain-containing protein [Photobacterium damselae]
MLKNAIDNLLISISRLIAIDSAGVAIAEIDLREGGILIGGGNIGKTSILNAIRLFLLPEENFKDSKNKFGFSDKEGNFYSNDECFEHYFPSSTSFLILECDNYLGGPIPHCQILYRGSSEKLDYRRLFTSLRYEQIRHLFWDDNAGDNGIGGRVNDLSLSKVQAYLKSHDKHFKPLVRSSAIRDIIYANQLLDIDAMRFCLFPLNSTKDADVDAFRALVRLLFDMKTGSDTVRLAVANIIESRKKERKDELNFDIDAFINHNEMLSRRELTLKKIESLRPVYEKLVLSHQELVNNKHAEDALMQYAMMLDSRITHEKQILEQEEKRLTLQKGKVSSAKKACDGTLDKQKTLQGEINALSRRQKKLDDTVQKTSLIVNQYDESETIESIVSGHREHLADKEQALALKQDAQKRQTELEDLKQEVGKLEEMEARYLTSINAQEYKLFNQLPESVWMKLAAVNLEIAESNPTRPLTLSEQQAIKSFTDLLEEQEQHYTLWGLELEPIQVDNRESDQIRLSKVQETLECKRKRMLDLSAMDSQSRFERVKDISVLETEIKRTRNEISLLLAYTNDSHQLTEINKELAEAEQARDSLGKQFKTQNEQLVQEKLLVEAQTGKLTEKKEQLEELNGYQVRVKAELQAHHLPVSDFSVLPDQTVDLSEETLHKRIESLYRKRQAKTDVTERLQDFVREQVLENDDKLMLSHLDDELLEHAFHQLQSRYQGLDEELDILRKHFIEHKHSVHAIINELKNNREMVRQFEQSINRAFQGVVINDLSQVEAKIKVEARFDDLVNEIEFFDTHSDQKASEQFIDRLKAFSKKFFPEGKAALLTMEQIVSGISYRVKKQGQEGWETKSQSTSTIMLINIKLVEILLGRLRNSACSTQFPLVIDEGASVDSSQFDWLLPNMKQAGFRVLSASTNSASSEIIFKFGQHFRLDAMRTATPYSKARTIAFTGMPEGFVTKGSQLDREQLDMFGEADE